MNDNWVCHPTWASEDGGFVAHKKNQYEEALYRCEEERYEFDLNIESNKSVIVRLEPILHKLNEMASREALAQDENKESEEGTPKHLITNFKLPDGLGDGYSSTIYKRVIKKIYDRERGQQAIDSLHEHPAVAVAILLKRLKQKDEEWRRNQVFFALKFSGNGIVSGEKLMVKTFTNHWITKAYNLKLQIKEI